MREKTFIISAFLLCSLALTSCFGPSIDDVSVLGAKHRELQQLMQQSDDYRFQNTQHFLQHRVNGALENLQMYDRINRDQKRIDELNDEIARLSDKYDKKYNRARYMQLQREAQEYAKY